MNAFMYIACALIWGLNFIVVKVQGTANALEVSLFYRTLIALLLFMVLYVLRIRAKQHTLPRHVWATVAGFGACSFALSYLLLYHATIYSNAALVALIFSLKVMVTPLLIAAVFKTPVSKRVFWGGMLGIAGVGVIVVPNLGQMQTQFVWGLGFAIAGTLVTAVGDTLSYYNNQQQVEPITANAFGMLSASVLVGAYTLWTGAPLRLPHSWAYWLGLLYLAVLGSFAAWLMYVYLIRSIGVVKGSYMVALFPAIAGTASVLLGETQLSWQLVLGIGLAMVGAAVALRKNS